MAARIVHHAAAERLLKCVEFKNPDRFRFGIIMPDSAGWSSEESKKAHFLKLICSGTKKTYDLTAFRSRFGRKVMTDDIYLFRTCFFAALFTGNIIGIRTPTET